MTELRFPKPARNARKSAKRGQTSKRRNKEKALKRECAKLWADWIKREGRCDFIGKFVGNRQHLRCAGSLQAMHGFGKKAYPGVRYATWNGIPGCGAVHVFYTHHPELWCEELRSRWGAETYVWRLLEAVETKKYDLEQVAATYKAALSGVD